MSQERRFDSLKDEFEALVKGRCDCETYFFCEWHQRLRSGHDLEDIVHNLRLEDLHDEYLELLDRLCECTPTGRCYWHQAFTDLEDLKELIPEMEGELGYQHYLWWLEQEQNKCSEGEEQK